MERSEDSRRVRAVAWREGRGGMRVVLEGMRDVSQFREGRGRKVVEEEAESWRWRVRAVSVAAIFWWWLTVGSWLLVVILGRGGVWYYDITGDGWL